MCLKLRFNRPSGTSFLVHALPTTSASLTYSLYFCTRQILISILILIIILIFLPLHTFRSELALINPINMETIWITVEMFPFFTLSDQILDLRSDDLELRKN